MEPWSGRGWQHVPASKMEYQHREELFHPHGAEHRAGEVTGWSLCHLCCPTRCPTRSPLRRLRFLLPLSLHTCRCGRQIEHRVHELACWAKRVRIRKCNSQSLPGGRWEGDHQRYGPRDLDLGEGATFFLRYEGLFWGSIQRSAKVALLSRHIFFRFQKKSFLGDTDAFFETQFFWGSQKTFLGIQKTLFGIQKFFFRDTKAFFGIQNEKC